MFSSRARYKYDIAAATKIIDSVAVEHTDELACDDVVRTHQFLKSAFREYEENSLIEQVNFAFLIPVRVSRESAAYWRDTYDFLPALKYLEPSDAYKVISSIPPCRLEMYGEPGDSSSGVLVFVPVLSDMAKDYKNKLRLLRLLRKRINDSAEFAYKRFGARYIGLGATLPKLSNYGKSIPVPVVTTTGHAGTTWLIVKTVEKLITDRPQLMRSDLTIGFIGGGAIGLASMQSLASKFPDSRFIAYDIRKEINDINRNKLMSLGKNIEIARSNRELLEASHLVISAVTTNIDIDGIDLVGKIILDDSQPGSFDRDQVIRQGGELVWVVGRDYSNNHFVTRRTGYSYGPDGLFNTADVWGCEAEVAAIAYANRPELAIRNAVALDDINEIGKLLEDLGIVVSEYQSFGKLNG